MKNGERRLDDDGGALGRLTAGYGDEVDSPAGIASLKCGEIWSKKSEPCICPTGGFIQGI